MSHSLNTFNCSLSNLYIMYPHHVVHISVSASIKYIPFVWHPIEYFGTGLCIVNIIDSVKLYINF